tara:strand:+ start:5589 stop:5804 length:216 start_codon:yes stop_codon:yes gene_type:complete
LSYVDSISWITVVLGFISVLLFGYPEPTFFQYAMGLMSVNNFLKKLNVSDMKNNIIRWIGANMGIRQKLIY